MNIANILSVVWCCNSYCFSKKKLKYIKMIFFRFFIFYINTLKLLKKILKKINIMFFKLNKFLGPVCLLKISFLLKSGFLGKWISRKWIIFLCLIVLWKIS